MGDAIYFCIIKEQAGRKILDFFFSLLKQKKRRKRRDGIPRVLVTSLQLQHIFDVNSRTFFSLVHSRVRASVLRIACFIAKFESIYARTAFYWRGKTNRGKKNLRAKFLKDVTNLQRGEKEGKEREKSILRERIS